MEALKGSGYDFVSTLGIGKFGKVVKVTSKKDAGSFYAMKVIELNTQNLTFAEVVKELDILTDLDHPNLVRIFDALPLQSDDGDINKIGVLMELCELGDLRTFIYSRRGKRFRSQTMQKWMLELCSAVGYIHSKAIMHRDLKPSNVFIDEKTSLKIGDFGVARNVLNSLAATVIGSTSFMAPETLTGSYYLEADVYSLGCVFLCMAVVDIHPKSPSGKFQPLPPKFAYGEKKTTIIKRCLEAEKAKRPTAQDIYNVLINDDYESLCLSTVRSANINLAINPYVAFREHGSKSSGVVLSSRPLRQGEKFCLEIQKLVQPGGPSSVVFGFTSREPESLDPANLHSIKDITKQVTALDSWFLTASGCMTEGSKFAFWFEKNGLFMYDLDGAVSVDKDPVQSWRQLWAVFEMHTGILQVQLSDYD